MIFGKPTRIQNKTAFENFTSRRGKNPELDIAFVLLQAPSS
jgi:hypothetical protein